MTENAVTLRIKAEKKDYLYAEHLFEKTSRPRRLERMAAIVLLLGGISSFVQRGVNWAGATILAMSLFLLLDAWVFQAVVMLLRRKGYPEEEFSLSFSQSGVLVPEKAQSPTPWKRYSRLIEDAEMFLLVKDKRNFAFIPKRAFPNEVTLATFRDLARRDISNYVTV